MRLKETIAFATPVAVLVGLVVAGWTAGVSTSADAGLVRPLARPHPAGARPLGVSSPLLDVEGLVGPGSRPPSDASCRASRGMPCYSPQEIRHAYGVDRLLDGGGVGAGQSIVIVDAFGSPTLASDLSTFDAGYGLPAPPSLKVLTPLGTAPFDPSSSDESNWALETTLDVEWAHAMAPEANIVVLTSPVDEKQGLGGLPQFHSLLDYALDHHLGNVISQSWGATENGLFTADGDRLLQSFERTYARAASMGVTVFASAGDTGAANPEPDGTTFYPFPTVNFPASSPFVTAVGGTSLHANTNGDYQSETVWNDDGGAGGGGISQKFAEPPYQRSLPSSVQRELGGNRGLPDVSWNADPRTPILIYASFLGPGAAGYYAVGGTSEGAPQWAGVIADVDQLVGHPLGLLNPSVYALGATGEGFHAVIGGNNSTHGVTGYNATPGWNPATGWGTPDIGQLVDGIAPGHALP